MLVRASVQLPGCRPDGGDEPPVAMLRALTGDDEEWLHSLPEGTGEAAVVTQLLARGVESLDGAPAGVEMVRGLVVGDRDLLLLRLWALTLGERVELVLTCPAPSCGARLTLAFELGDLPVRRGPVHPAYPVDGLPPGVVHWLGGRVPRLRLPTGEDLELMQALPPGDAAIALLARLVDVDPAALRDADVVEALQRSCAALLDDVMPGVERDIDAECAECGRAFSLELDIPRAFVDEMLSRRAEFEADLHRLAFHYHWSPRDILALPRPRRAEFVRVLLARLDGGDGVEGLDAVVRAARPMPGISTRAVGAPTGPSGGTR